MQGTVETTWHNMAQLAGLAAVEYQRTRVYDSASLPNLHNQFTSTTVSGGST